MIITLICFFPAALPARMEQPGQGWTRTGALAGLMKVANTEPRVQNTCLGPHRWFPCGTFLAVCAGPERGLKFCHAN